MFIGSRDFGFKFLKLFLKSSNNVNWFILCPKIDDERDSYLNDFKELSEKNNFFFDVISNDKQVESYIKKLKPEILIVCGYYKIISKEIISLFKLGAWGVHNSLLPKYRGGAPLVWQIINNEKVLGSTIFKLKDGIDNGPILDQVRIKNNIKICINDASELIIKEWGRKIPLIWSNFNKGKIKVTNQKHHLATYSSARKESDGLINWKKSADKIDCFIRAQKHPYPGAFFYFNKQKVKIVEYSLDNKIVYGISGQVFEVKKSYVSVCCGASSIIKLKELLINKKIKKASVLLKSRNIRL